MRSGEEYSARLQVGAAYPEDEGKSLGRMSRKTLKALGLGEGDMAEVRAERLIVVTAAPAHLEDDGLDLIRLNAVDREQAGVTPGEFAEVRPAQVRPARRVVLAQARRSGDLGDPASAVREALLGYVVSEGAVLRLRLHDRHLGGKLSILGIEIVEAEAESGEAEPLVLRVVATHPQGAVRIVEDTAIELLDGESGETA